MTQPPYRAREVGGGEPVANLAEVRDRNAAAHAYARRTARVASGRLGTVGASLALLVGLSPAIHPSRDSVAAAFGLNLLIVFLTGVGALVVYGLTRWIAHTHARLMLATRLAPSGDAVADLQRLESSPARVLARRAEASEPGSVLLPLLAMSLLLPLPMPGIFPVRGPEDAPVNLLFLVCLAPAHFVLCLTARRYTRLVRRMPSAELQIQGQRESGRALVMASIAGVPGLLLLILAGLPGSFPLLPLALLYAPTAMIVPLVLNRVWRHVVEERAALGRVR